MILDALLKVDAAAQITADAVSVSSVDLGNITPKRKIGAGEPLCLVVIITAIGTNTGSSRIEVITSAAAALTSPLVIGEIDIAAADIVAGAVFIVPIAQGIALLRYIGANYDITGTVDFTVDSYITPLSMASTIAESYAKGYTIS